MLDFARKFGGWFSLVNDRGTVKAASQLASLGLLQVSRLGMARATDMHGDQFQYAGADMTDEQKTNHEKYLDSLDQG